MLIINGEEIDISSIENQSFKYAEKLSNSEDTLSFFCDNKSDKFILLINIKTNDFTYILADPINNVINNDIRDFFTPESIITKPFSKFIFIKNKNFYTKVENNILKIFYPKEEVIFDNYKDMTKNINNKSYYNYCNVSLTSQKKPLKNNIPNLSNDIKEMYYNEQQIEIDTPTYKTTKEVSKSETSKKEEKISIKQMPSMSKQEKAEILNHFIKANDFTTIINSINGENIFSINNLTGEVSEYSYQDLLNNENLYLESDTELLSIIKSNIDIVQIVNYISICDIRTSYKYYKEKKQENETVKKINYIIYKDILYLTIVPKQIVDMGLSIKDYSVYLYNNKEIKDIRSNLFKKYETYGKKILLIIENNKTSLFVSTFKDRTSEKLNIAEIINEFSIDDIYHLINVIPIENIIDISEVEKSSVENLIKTEKKVLHLCDYKHICDDDDELSYAYEEKTKSLFYFIEDDY